MKVEILRHHGMIIITGFCNDRKVYCIEKTDGEKWNDWNVSMATMPTGDMDQAKQICQVSLKCHVVMEKFKAGDIECGAVILLSENSGTFQK